MFSWKDESGNLKQWHWRSQPFWKENIQTKTKTETKTKPEQRKQLVSLLINFFPFLLALNRSMPTKKEKRDGSKIKVLGCHLGDPVSVPGSVKHFICDLVNVTFEHVKPSGLIYETCI